MVLSLKMLHVSSKSHHRLLVHSDSLIYKMISDFTSIYLSVSLWHIPLVYIVVIQTWAVNAPITGWAGLVALSSQPRTTQNSVILLPIKSYEVNIMYIIRSWTQLLKPSIGLVFLLQSICQLGITGSQKHSLACPSKT